MIDIPAQIAPDKVFRNVWAICVMGFDHKGQIAILSYQQAYPSEEIAEAAGLIRWRKSYPKATDLPTVIVQGPFLKERK